MTIPDTLQPAAAALDRCEEALMELEVHCCEPTRSPNMRALGAVISEARSGLESAADDGGETAVAHLKDAAVRIGRLASGCCTPRLPFYRQILDNLVKARLVLRQELEPER